MFRRKCTIFSENKMSVLKTIVSGKLLFVTRNLFGGNDEILISNARLGIRRSSIEVQREILE
jgi:hypothetical protein